MARRRPRLAALLAAGLAMSFFAACHEATAPRRGSLIVTASGIPTGVTASVTVAGPNGYSATANLPATLSNLPPGTYTATVGDISTASGRWTPDRTTQQVDVQASGTATTASFTYTLATTRLSLVIAGLPENATASVTVTGPYGFTRQASSSQAIDGVAPGSYTITAQDVQNEAFKYGASPSAQTLVLTASTVPVVGTVTYAVTTGRLVMSVVGLPNGIAPAGTVTGPNGFTADLESDGTLRYLVPGTYDVAARDVTVGSLTYVPIPRTQSVQVTAGASPLAAVVYTGPTPAVDLRVVVQGLTNPVYLTAPANDSRLFIVEQPGRIRVVRGGQLLAQPFLDISARIAYSGERGLLSMAFDPAYAANGRFFVYFTGPNGDITVERYGSTPGADVASATPTPVLTIPHRDYGNHNGGLLMFGPDGKLYLGTGDGGGGGDPLGNSQNLDSFLGKMLRIDVTTLPHTLSRADIFAYGLRNPWRFDFQQLAGGTWWLYIADVGQDHYEEVDVALSSSTPPLNFDWNRMEGTHCYPSGTGCVPTIPAAIIWEYDHSQGCSIVGGFYYQGAGVPWLKDSYLFSDYCSGGLHSLSGDPAFGYDVTNWPIPGIGNVLSFGKDAAGEVYMLSQNGSVYKIVPK